MNAKKKRRLAFAAALVAVGVMLAVLIRYGLGQNIMYFHSPTEAAAGQVEQGVAFRLGGLVEKGSVSHGAGAEVKFRVTDGKGSVPAEFVGVLPVARSFEFKLADSDEIVRGKISPKVGDVETLNDHLHQRVRVEVMRTQVGNGRPRFLLTQLPQWAAAAPAGG